jgi:hypothetical protein
MITWPKTLTSITVTRENQRDKPNSRTPIAHSPRQARTEFLESDRLKRLDLRTQIIACDRSGIGR